MRWIELGSDWAICLENFFCKWVLQLQEVVGLGQLSKAGAHGPFLVGLEAKLSRSGSENQSSTCIDHLQVSECMASGFCRDCQQDQLHLKLHMGT